MRNSDKTKNAKADLLAHATLHVTRPTLGHSKSAPKMAMKMKRRKFGTHYRQGHIVNYSKDEVFLQRAFLIRFDALGPEHKLTIRSAEVSFVCSAHNCISEDVSNLMALC